MSLTGILFIFLFLPVALIIYHITPDKAKEYVLLTVSLLFYAIGSSNYFLLIVLLMVFTVVLGRIMYKLSGETSRKLILVAGIILNIGALFLCKYLNFFLTTINKICGLDFGLGQMLLPLGISFYTFKAVSYLADIYTQKAALSKNPVHDALYLSFFPHIQAGPIERYTNFKKTGDRLSAFSAGAFRFMTGFTKKVLIANVLANITGEVFGAPFESFSVSFAWLGSICFSLELFLDFSGYSDMAVGLSKMFGFECMENFEYPYITESVSKFWRRWHISLSEWFRDYVYIPLGGSKNKKKVRTYFNLLVVWVLTGLWHGAAWNFVAWGLGYFLAVSFERVTGITKKLRSRVGKAVYRIFVLLFINAEWVLFNAGGFKRGLGFLKRMVICAANRTADYRTAFLLKDYCFFILAAIVLCFPIVPAIKKKLSGNGKLSSVFEAALYVIAAAGFVLALSFAVSGYNNPFAYANF